MVNLVNIKSFDLYTYQHSVNVCVLCVLIGVALCIPRNEMRDLALAAVLHDIGKVFINKEILNKPGKLTPEEFEVIKNHTQLGYDFINKKNILSASVYIPVLMHHERYDGTGYLSGQKGEAIPLFSQIISVSDVYDAITSDRPYHEAILPSEAYEYILGNAGRHFSPKIVDVFVKKIAPFPEGYNVQLSNGMAGIVYKNYEDCLARPLIKLHRLPGQQEDRFVDLKNDKNALDIIIQKILT